MADTDLFLQLDKKIDRSPTTQPKQRSPGERTSRRPLPTQQPAAPLSSNTEKKAQFPHSKENLPTSDERHDVMTSPLHDVNLRAWREVIENTETQNSALRLTSAERFAVEDVVNDLRRKEKVKTSMNEIARLGLLLLIHDFVKNKRTSLLYRIKKA